ncbi:MAG: RNA methyltransferase [Methylococcaceae bacterium]|nr:RNA methyltransferase [Methylococcaceae bacterium]
MSKPNKPKPPSARRSSPPPSRPVALHSRTAGRSKPASESAESQEKLSKIAGLQAVAALFRSDPSRVMRLYYDEKMKNAVGDFCSQMARMHRPYRMVEEAELEKIAGTVLHGGVVAATLPRDVADFSIEAAAAWARSGENLLILDGVGNPHNLGAIARSMAFFDMKYLVISDHPAQAGLSDSAHRVAEGGLEHIEVYRAMGLPGMLKRLAEYYRVVGTALGGKAVSMAELPPDPRPLALVLGNEEHGLPAETLAVCEARLIIPGSGRVQSLNVSATAAILIHELVNPRTQSARPKPTPTSNRARGVKSRR